METNENSATVIAPLPVTAAVEIPPSSTSKPTPPDYSRFVAQVGKVFERENRRVMVVGFSPRFANGEGLVPVFHLDPPQTVECEDFLRDWTAV